MSRYVAAHANAQGAGDARPTAMQIVQDEGLTGKLTDKVMLVTGGSSGIGIETVRAFHATGAKVFTTVRDLAKGQKIVDELRKHDPSNKAEIVLIKLELDSLDSVRAGAKEILGKTDKLNVLVNNAGVMGTPYGKTKDGFERQFGTNHVGHFLLFQLLKDTLIKSSTKAFQSRVVSVTSTVHRAGEVRFSDYNFETPDSYDPWLGYGQAKTCNIYLANEIERRHSSQGLHATSLHPGAIQSGLQVHVPEMAESAFATPELKKVEKTSRQGAATTVYAALSKDFEGKGGVYLSNCAIMGPSVGNVMDPTDEGYAPYAYDAGKEGRLWKDSLKMVGLKDDE